MTPRMTLAAAGLVACAVCHAQQNPAARPPGDVTPLAGTWNGAHLEQRSGCINASSNGFHGTYSGYIFRLEANRGLNMDEIAVTGLTCNYAGQYRDDAARWIWSGTLSCSDGRAGTFESQSIFALTQLMSLRLSIRLTGTESCAIDAILSGARF